MRTACAGVLLLPSLSIIVLRRNVCLSRQLHIPPTDAFVVAFVAKLTVQNLVPKVSRVREMEQNQKSTKKIFRNYGVASLAIFFFQCDMCLQGTKDDSSDSLAFLFECVFVFPLGGDGAVTFLFAYLPFFWLQLQK